MNTSFKLELNSKPKQDKTSSILIRITQNRKLKRYSSGVNVFPEDFNKKAEYGKWIRKSNPDHKRLNNQLEEKIQEAKEALNSLEKENKSASAKSIISKVKEENAESLLKYFEAKLILFFQTKSVGYYKHLKSKLNNLSEYLKGKDILFSEVNVTFLNEYESYLLQRGLNKNSTASNLKAIRTIINEAIKEDIYTGQSPFAKKRLTEIKVEKGKLSIEEIKKLENLDLDSESILWHVRNYFLFSFYTAGTRISDIMQLSWRNIKKDRLSFTMEKTEEQHSVILVPQAQKILEHYKKPKVAIEDFVFPILDNKLRQSDKLSLCNQISSKNAMINMNLKKLQELAKIDIKLTFHLSRHSFADMLRRKGVSIYDIKNLLGHSDIKITQRYLKGFDTITSDKALSESMQY